MTTTTLERTGRAAMPARKLKAAAPAARPTRSVKAASSQPPYHTEISSDYLDALQRQVDSTKPEGFKLTPITAPGW